MSACNHIFIPFCHSITWNSTLDLILLICTEANNLQVTEGVTNVHTKSTQADRLMDELKDIDTDMKTNAIQKKIWGSHHQVRKSPQGQEEGTQGNQTRNALFHVCKKEGRVAERDRVRVSERANKRANVSGWASVQTRETQTSGHAKKGRKPDKSCKSRKCQNDTDHRCLPYDGQPNRCTRKFHPVSRIQRDNPKSPSLRSRIMKRL